MDTNTDNKLRLFTRGQGKRLKLRGLRRRWLASSVGPIIVILVLRLVSSRSDSSEKRELFREDIHELFEEIIYSDNERLYK